MKLRIGNKTYSPLYKFDGGEYFTDDKATSGEAWIALMDDGSLQLLINGVHTAYDAEYELITDEPLKEKNMKLYYIDIDGRSNHRARTMRDVSFHRELVKANSAKEAKEIAWEHFLNDMNDIWKITAGSQRSYKITAEDVTGVYAEDEVVYYTAERCRKADIDEVNRIGL